MAAEGRSQPPQTRHSRVGIVIVAITVLICATAIFFQTPLRSRMWAARAISTADPAQRAAYLTMLCNAGEAGWWGTSTLLTDARSEVRQWGVVVLHHVRTQRSRLTLLRLLTDPDNNVVELAALGLAIHGNDAAVGQLSRLYQEGSDAAARAACLTLGRLGTPLAVRTLCDMVSVERGADRVAALIDALDSVGSVEVVPALISLLPDDRLCSQPSQRDVLARTVLGGVAEQGLALPALVAASQPRGLISGTIADRAAAVLERITGIHRTFSTPPSAAWARDCTAWRDWYEAHASASRGAASSRSAAP